MDNNQNENKQNMPAIEEEEVTPSTATDVVSTEEIAYDRKQEPEEETKKIKRSFLDFNFSWIMIFISAAVIIGFGTLQLQNVPVKIPPTLYIFIAIIVSILVNSIVYASFKLIGGILGGYQLTKIQFFGFTVVLPHQKGKKSLISFKIGDFMDFHFLMTPKKEKTNHYLYHLFGMFGYLLLSIIVIGVSFLFENGSLLQVSFLFSLAYGALIPLYELLPCRLDYANDCFILIKTRKADDLRAYNLELRNIRHMLLDEDLEIEEFDDYGTYHKSHILYYNYLDALLNNNVDKALEYLKEIQVYMLYYPDELKVSAIAEKLFIRLFSEEYDVAEEFYGTLSHDFKHRICDNGNLSHYRSSLAISALINNSLQETQEVLDAYGKHAQKMSEYSSERKEKEQQLFNLTLKLVNSVRPNWELDAEKKTREPVSEDLDDED